MGFYEKYIETVTKNDVRTRNSVDAIIGRMDELLDDRPDGRLSGLVVGRVQSGKTRNYVGLALKAAEAGWNVIESHLIIGAFDSEEEAKNLCAYLKTKFVLFLVARKQVLKQRQNRPRRKKSWYSEQSWEAKRWELSWNSFEYVPVQDFSKSWTDAELYKEYELDEEEIDFIESNIKAIEDDDCDVLSGDKEVSHV